MDSEEIEKIYGWQRVKLKPAKPVLEVRIKPDENFTPSIAKKYLQEIRDIIHQAKLKNEKIENDGESLL